MMLPKYGIIKMKADKQKQNNIMGVGKLKPEIVSLAVDFGASSGRVILSRFDGRKVELEEVYRFPNEPVRMGGHFYWDFLRLFYELKNGLKRAASKGVEISSIGIDAWGVDYGLLDEGGNLISNPVHYRDSRTDDIIKHVKKIIPYEQIYNTTGIQYMQINSLYQLYADYKYRPDILKKANTLLFMPDLFNFYLTGNKYSEYTESSTSQMLHASHKTWAVDMLKKLSLPTHILQDIIMPGNIYGRLTEDIQGEVGLSSIPVVSVGSHDTASAVAGTPLDGQNSVFLSSGTWSLFGTEIDKPIINENSMKYNFTNEGGVGDTIMFLKNINGLWIIQQLKNSWSEHFEKVSFPDITVAAMNAEKKHFIIDPNHKLFMAPLNMAEAIKDYCSSNGQGTPKDLGEIAIAAYNGLAHEYSRVTSCLEEITGRKIDTINMIGGGIQDEFLCQLTADVTGRTILAGPVEASVFGNIIVQLMAVGAIDSLYEGRRIVMDSIAQKQYKPRT